MSQSFDFNLWHQMLKEELWWKEVCPDYAIHVYRATVNAWGHGARYYTNDPCGDSIELTKLYEQCKIVSLLKDTQNGQEISSTEC